MNINTPSIITKIDLDTQKLLSKVAAIVGVSSINSFILNASIEKAKNIIQKENTLKLSHRDAMLLVKALEQPQSNPRLKQAMQNYKTKYELKINKKKRF